MVDDYEIIAEDSGSHSFEVLSNDTDLDGDSLQIVEIALDDPTLGVAGISADGRAVEFEPASDAHGVATVSYKVSDGVASSMGTLTLEISPENDAPESEDDMLTVSEDSSSVLVDVLANDTDADNDALTVSAPVADNGATVTVLDNQINYRPAADFYGTESVRNTKDDGN